MNRDMRRMINERRRDGARGYSRGGRRGGYSRGRSDGRFDGNIDRLDYDDDYPMDDYDNYDSRDGRRGVKGTGPYGIGGRLHYPRRDRASYDVDVEYDGAHEEMRLSKRDMGEWKRDLENADGTVGAHFDAQQIEQAMEALNIRPRGYDEKTLCMTANMLYSDYCEVLKQFVPKEKEALVYVKLAKAFLDDDDAAVQGEEKLAAYYYTIVCDE